MKKQMLLGLCLGGCLVIAGPAAIADDGKSNNRSARAVQVHIDKEGKKTAPDDSADTVTAPLASSTSSNDAVSRLMPAVNSSVSYAADGMMSARLGITNLQYVVMTINKDGNKSMRHETAKDLDSALAMEPTESEEK